MTIEDNIFNKRIIIYDKLVPYGFKKTGNKYLMSKLILNNTFKIEVTVSNHGKIKGKIFDLSSNEEYTNFRVEKITGEFVSRVKELFETFLLDISKECTQASYFVSKQANLITQLIKDKYGDEPNFAWDKYPNYAVFKNKDNHKWYGLIMNIDKSKLDKKYTGEIEVINVKLNPNHIEQLLKETGFYPAYHMNKKNWLTIILDDKISNQKIMSLIEESYNYTIKSNTIK